MDSSDAGDGTARTTRTADTLAQALAALGVPVAGQPSDGDVPALLGVLTAVVEAAVHDHLNEVRDLEQFTAAYDRQTAGHPVSAVQLIAQRLGVASDQLRRPSTAGGQVVSTIAGAADAAQSAHALLSYQTFRQYADAVRVPEQTLTETLRIADESSTQSRAHLDAVLATARTQGLLP
ncbi:hypothetical protein Cs7R123_54220 [Catellatospora sp. TT07R-123]|uniref:hypothetical protein n=1 Tax=Catellatospora sp. TT07R-123 TaxID=2733863 RepID=UPI001AFF49EC|nr:hypothetical protein [Catellatospora sp. TT07R-123]GHJ48080.1 hypothetical protein Cs7R123_54220 [Catellatospora sp. TT07R-123]